MVECINLDLPAAYRSLSVLDACVAAMLSHIEGISEQTAYGIRLAMHEVCTNIIAHAYRGRTGRIGVQLALSGEERCFEIKMRDTGLSFDPASVPVPSPELPQEHGYGLLLIRSLMDEVTYVTESDGNCWHLRKRL